MAGLVGSPNLVLKGLNAVFMEGVQEVRPSLVPKLAQRVPSDTLTEKYLYPTAVTKPRKWTDDRVPTNIDATVVYEITNETYEVTIDMHGNLIQDNQAFSLGDLIREAGMSMALYPDELLSTIIRLGATSGNNAYDGNTFYGDTHVFASSGNPNAPNIDNKLAGSGTTVAQLSTDLQAALAALWTFKDDQSRLINPHRVGVDQLVIHCHPQIEYQWRQVVNAGITVLQSDNRMTGNVLNGIADVVADGYLTDVNDWYLHFVGMPTRPFIFQDREQIGVQTLGFDSEYYRQTGRVMIVARMRLKMAYHRFERSVLTVNS